MNNNINIAELLKDCPKGMELYSPLCGKCVFDRLNMGTIICKKQNTQEIAFTSKGYYMLPVFENCECMIFPSKEQRDWSKFCPFKDGDVLSDNCSVFIFKSRMFDKGLNCYVYNSHCHFVPLVHLRVKPGGFNHIADNVSFATEEEKQKLFQAIKENGYKWNAKTKTLEKLVEPKFKAGDKIQQKNQHEVCLVSEVCDNHYLLDEKDIVLPFFAQDDLEFAPDKFDITTLNPFDKVLVRNEEGSHWMMEFFESVYKNGYLCYKGLWKKCVPYEGNQHLLDTTNDCDEYYKTWKDETDE